MILTCSSCTTRFLVNAAAIGPMGRQVRCARCQHGWFQEPATDLPRFVSPAPQTVEPAENDAASSVGDAWPSGRPAPLRRGANLPALPARSSHLRDSLAWGALALFLLVLTGGGYIYSARIMMAWPQTSNLYAALGVTPPSNGLRLTDVSFSQAMMQGRPALTVKGVVVNDGASERTAPLVLVKLRNAGGRDIFEWTYQLPGALLAAGAKVAFETSLADPPAEARNLEVTFKRAE